MANTFAEKITKYIPLLDEVYQRESLTSFLEQNPMNVMWDGAKTIKLPKYVLDGAADYSRTTGYNKGAVTVTWESHTLAYDRGRKFGIDVIDDDELGAKTFMTVASEYIRTKEIPETDAVRFMKMYNAASTASNVVEADTIDALSAYDTAEETLGNNAIPEENRIMWCSYAYYKALKQDTAVARRIDAGDVTVNGINRTVALLDGVTPIIKVPKDRFYTLVNLLDGTTAGEEAGGYEPTASTSKEIHFIYADRGALNAVTKRRVSKVIGWQQNPDSDENLVFYRNHHDLIVPDNKNKGVYVYTKETAITA